jgi:hypothetical protein
MTLTAATAFLPDGRSKHLCPAFAVATFVPVKAEEPELPGPVPDLPDEDASTAALVQNVVLGSEGGLSDSRSTIEGG